MNLKLDLGCGKFIKPGFLGFDISKECNADVIQDLNLGIPCRDNEVIEIHSSHFLEHAADEHFILREIHRVCKPNATVTITVPLFEILSPDHKTYFYGDWFERNLDNNKFKIVNKEIRERIVTDSDKIKRNFDEITVCLKVLK
jgi:predicted SAM-dependent methyltransferase